MGVNVVVLGDLNARVGDIPVEGVVGNFGVTGRNENGSVIGMRTVSHISCWSSVWKGS